MAKSDHDPTTKNAEKNPRRWSLDDAKRVLTEFEASGLTLTAFAAREGLGTGQPKATPWGTGQPKATP